MATAVVRTSAKLKLSPEAMTCVETTVRWLKERHPEYIDSVSKTWPQKLIAALIRMSWREVDLVRKRGLFKEAYATKIREAVTGWSKAEHEEMVKFLERGGYAAEAAELTSDIFSVVTDDGTESIALEMDEVDEAMSGLSPKAQMSPDHELEAIVADAAKQMDPRYGAW